MGKNKESQLARHAYHERKILILDEATSALDSKTEEEIVDEIKKELKGSTTMVIISHRNSTVKHCDRIYVLENGIIKRTGTPENILTTYEK